MTHVTMVKKKVLTAQAKSVWRNLTMHVNNLPSLKTQVTKKKKNVSKGLVIKVLPSR